VKGARCRRKRLGDRTGLNGVNRGIRVARGLVPIELHIVSDPWQLSGDLRIQRHPSIIEAFSGTGVQRRANVGCQWVPMSRGEPVLASH